MPRRHDQLEAGFQFLVFLKGFVHLTLLGDKRGFVIRPHAASSTGTVTEFLYATGNGDGTAFTDVAANTLNAAEAGTIDLGTPNVPAPDGFFDTATVVGDPARIAVYHGAGGRHIMVGIFNNDTNGDSDTTDPEDWQFIVLYEE